jgi:hypothetical protein
MSLSVLPVLLLAGCSFSPGNNTTSSSSSSVMNPDITVSSPTAGSTVSSPLTVTGEAKGGWYFEASFPVHLLDGNGNEIVSAPATAQGDWMTPNFVPFSVTLTFPTPATSTGTLVLEKDNPSGEPQNAASISIPVQF